MKTLNNYINGEWVKSSNTDTLEVLNPANLEVLTKVPFGKASKTDVDKAVSHAHKAYLLWKDVPNMKRVQPLFKLKALLETHKTTLAQMITNECGKTYNESMGELQRAIENVEVA